MYALPAQTEVATAGKPCMRDMHKLVYDRLGGVAAIKNMELERLNARVDEEVAADSRFAEEGPLVKQHEAERRGQPRLFLAADMVELPSRA